MRNGVVSQRQPLERLTDANGSGSSPMWPTTTTTDAKRSGTGTLEGKHGITLTDRAVRMWGTPVARDDQKSPEAHLAMKSRMGGGRTEATSLTVQAKMWPTPRAHDGTSGGDKPSSHPKSGGEGLQTASRVWSMTGRHRSGPHAPTTAPAGNDGSQRADLNPRFVAALMGVPWDWLNPCTPVATDSYREWLEQHSLNSPHDSG